MDDLSNFESRSGKVSCNAEGVYNFVTDIRNFERFVPKGTINGWTADRESCTFGVSMIGSVSVRLIEKNKFSKVVFDGDALKKNDFLLTLLITDGGSASADVKVALRADLNPMMKMMASRPISQFLEMLITEMERFTDWDNITE